MASTSEVGHAKNVANFQDLIEFVIGYDTNYNPSKNSLKLAELNALKKEAEIKLAEVITKNTDYNGKVNERFLAFSNLRSLSTRLVNALQTTEATKQTIDDAKGFNRKIQGKKASKPEVSSDPNAPAPKTISSSQQSFDQLIQHLSALKEVLKSEPSFTPNETDLQVTALEAKINDLTQKNTSVATAYTSVSNSRINRNKTLYTKENNLVETASEVKKYVKSVFGAKSPEFAQISGLNFKAQKDF
jgi:hypothetical protein